MAADSQHQSLVSIPHSLHFQYREKPLMNVCQVTFPLHLEVFRHARWRSVPDFVGGAISPFSDLLSFMVAVELIY